MLWPFEKESVALMCLVLIIILEWANGVFGYTMCSAPSFSFAHAKVKGRGISASQSPLEILFPPTMYNIYNGIIFI